MKFKEFMNKNITWGGLIKATFIGGVISAFILMLEIIYIFKDQIKESFQRLIGKFKKRNNTELQIKINNED